MCHQRIFTNLMCFPRSIEKFGRYKERHIINHNLKNNFVSYSCSRRNFSTNYTDTCIGKDIIANAQTVWDYLRIDSPLRKSDLILVLGNSDLRTADYAAKLYQEGYAPLVAVSGREGHHTKGKWKKPEAVVFAEHLMSKAVPADSILVEPNATNTGENIRFTQKLLQSQADLLLPGSLILIQTPFMGRRCLATFQKQWEKAEKVEVMVSSPPILLNQYPDAAAGYGTLLEVAREMLRNMRRILDYANKGFQVPQKVPVHVAQAYHELQAQLQYLGIPTDG